MAALELMAGVVAVLVVWRVLLVTDHLNGSPSFALKLTGHDAEAAAATILRHSIGLSGASTCYRIEPAADVDARAATVSLRSQIAPFDHITVRRGSPTADGICPP